jgi:hypothetical protein
MATWHEFCGLAGTFGGEQVGENAWRFDLQGRGEGRTQKVFVFREVLQPDFEFIQLKSAFVMMEMVNCAEVLKAYGQLNVGAIGYSPRFDANGNQIDGFLNISTSIPLAALDLSEPTVFFLYLNVLAQAADNLEQQLSAPGSTDLF